jgi:hypothetical protein
MTQAFLNHFGGNTYDDYGSGGLNGSLSHGSVSIDGFEIDSPTFSQGGGLDVEFTYHPSDDDGDSAGGEINITTNAVPEPSTLILAGTAALLGLAHAWRQQRKSR